MATFLVWFIVLGSLRSLSKTLEVLPQPPHYRAPRARSILIACDGHPRLRVSLAVKLSASGKSSMPLAALLMLAPCLTGTSRICSRVQPTAYSSGVLRCPYS